LGNVDRQIHRFAQQDMDWSLVGPWLCSAVVQKDLGGPIRATERSFWFVAMSDARPSGFALIERKHDHWWMEAAWVRPEHRHAGLHGLLTVARLAFSESIDRAPRRMLVHESRWRHYRDRGWKILRSRGQFLTLERP
jgi:hypothetical protein